MCGTFLDALKLRERGDYDPLWRVDRSTTLKQIDEVEQAFDAWTHLSPDEARRFLIALFLFARGR